MTHRCFDEPEVARSGPHDRRAQVDLCNLLPSATPERILGRDGGRRSTLRSRGSSRAYLPLGPLRPVPAREQGGVRRPSPVDGAPGGSPCRETESAGQRTKTARRGIADRRYWFVLRSARICREIRFIRPASSCIGRAFPIKHRFGGLGSGLEASVVSDSPTTLF